MGWRLSEYTEQKCVYLVIIQRALRESRGGCEPRADPHTDIAF